MSRWNILQVSVRLLLFMILFNDRVSPFEICLNKVLMIVCTEVNYYHCAGDFVSNIFFLMKLGNLVLGKQMFRIVIF